MSRRRLLRVALAVVVSAATVTLSGCADARNDLGTNVSPCFVTLPVAEDALHGAGRFAGVIMVKAAALDRRPDLIGSERLAERAGEPVTTVCVVAYHGLIAVDRVSRPIGPPPPGGVGRYALVVVSLPANHLLGTVVTNRLPFRFGHTHLG